MFGTMKGWTLMQALEQLSDPADLAARDRLNNRINDKATDRDVRGALIEELHELNAHLESNVIKPLRAFQLRASGFLLPLTTNSHREHISADLWELAEVQFNYSSMSAHNLRMVHIEVYGAMLDKAREDQPQNQRATASERAQQRLPQFQCSEDYTKVKIRDHVFLFHGSMQVAVVKQLHAASLTSAPWLYGKSLLAEAGSASNSIADLFKSHTDPPWQELIESNRRGRYRLRLLDRDDKAFK